VVRGIRFKLPKKHNSSIYKILEGVDFDRYIWEIKYDNVFNSNKEFLFKNKLYNGKNFRETISFPYYHTVFVTIQAFPIGMRRSKINDYSEFSRSNCELILLIEDEILSYIYTKNVKILEIIKENAEKHNFLDIDFITQQNDIISNFEIM